MTANEATIDHIITPKPAEELDMRRLEAEINSIFERHGQPRLVGPDGEEVPIPNSAFNALAHVARCMAQGKTIILMPKEKELSTQQAAEILNISRPFLVRLIDGGQIPATTVGRHRRLLAEDVFEYRRRRAVARRETLRKLTEISEDVEGGYR